jgi:hypothetical protein
MDVGVALCLYQQYTEYITVLCLYVILLLYFVPHWYVCLYAVGLAESVSLIVLCICFRFYIFMGVCVCAATWCEVRVFMISIVSVTDPYVFSMWFPYPELPLMFLMAWMCSLHLILNILPVCILKHFIWYMSFCYIYLFAYGACNIFCILFCIQTATFIRVLLKSLVVFLTSWPQYVKVAHFVSWCWGSVYMFCFCGGGGFSIMFVLYSLLRSMLLTVFIGRAIAQAVSRWLPTAAARVRARVWSSGIYGGQTGAGAGFLRVLRFPLPIFIPPITP